MGFKLVVRCTALFLLGAALTVPAILAAPRNVAAEQSTEAKPQAAAIAAYPESAEGLKNLLQDWFAAIKAGETAKSSQYLESLAIPNHQEWFAKTFGAAEGVHLEAKYTESQAKFAAALAVRAKQAVQAEKFLVKIRLFDKSACGQPPELYALSAAMVHPTPIYRSFNRTDAKDSTPSFLEHIA